MFCKNCGNQLPDDAKFCDRCGNSVMGYQMLKQKETQNQGGEVEKTKKWIKVGIAGLFIIVLLFGVFQVFRYETIYVLTEYESEYGSKNFTYDENGNCIEMKVYDASEAISYQYTYTYDYNGNCIKELVYKENGQIDYSCSHEWNYDENGNCIKYLSYDDNGTLYVDQKCNYGENTIEEYYYDKDSKSLEIYSIYEYDQIQNKLKETDYFGEQREYGGYYETIYDENGNVLNLSYHDENGSLSWRWEFEYDSLGNRVKALHYDEDGKLEFYYEYLYDENGNQIYGTYWEANDRDSYVEYGHDEYDYDENGNLLTIKNTTGVTEFIYDENGNRTEKIVNKESKVRCKYEALKIVRTEWIYGAFSNEMEENNILLDAIDTPSSRAAFIIEEWGKKGETF